MRIVSSGTSDDLGVYRIAGLPAGKYLVRTGAAQTEDALKLLPTYYPFASVLRRDARSISVELDTEVTDIDIQPAPGNLSSISVSVTGCLGLARVTLTSDAGRRQSTAACGHEPAIFTALASGEYELLAEGEADQKKLAALTVFHLVGDHQQFGVNLRPLPDLTVLRPVGTMVTLRRRDPAGEGPEFPLAADHIALPPGYWQITAHAPTGSYLADIRAEGETGLGVRRDSHPEWFEFSIESSSRVSVSVSPRQAQLSGRVISSGKEAIGAPVYLVPTTSLARRRMNGSRSTITDQFGNYHFDGLAPGTYLVFGSFDITGFTEDSHVGQAQSVTVEEGSSSTLDLVLYQLQ